MLAQKKIDERKKNLLVTMLILIVVVTLLLLAVYYFASPVVQTVDYPDDIVAIQIKTDFDSGFLDSEAFQQFRLFSELPVTVGVRGNTNPF